MGTQLSLIEQKIECFFCEVAEKENASHVLVNGSGSPDLEVSLLPEVASKKKCNRLQSREVIDDASVLLHRLEKVDPKAPFRVVPFFDLKSHQRLPRSNERLSILREELPSTFVVVFLSHRWLRPWWTQEECESFGFTWAGEAHPDDEEGTKFRLLTEGIEALAMRKSWDLARVTVWMDFACIDQDNLENRIAGVMSLLGYMARSHTVIIPTLEIPGFATAHRVPGEYGVRAWTRLEALGFYVMSLLENKHHPELFYSAPGKVVDQLDYVLLPYAMPSSGMLCQESDREFVVMHEETLLNILHLAALGGNSAARGPAMVADAGCGKVNLLLELIDAGNVHVDTKDNNGITALWSGARQGHVGIVNLLLERGANAALSPNSGLSPMHCSAQQGHLKTVESLIRADAAIDMRDNSGFTPLLWATQGCHIEVVKTLLQEGAKDVEISKAVAHRLITYHRSKSTPIPKECLRELIAMFADTPSDTSSGLELADAHARPRPVVRNPSHMSLVDQAVLRVQRTWQSDNVLRTRSLSSDHNPKEVIAPKIGPSFPGEPRHEKRASQTQKLRKMARIPISDDLADIQAGFAFRDACVEY